MTLPLSKYDQMEMEKSRLSDGVLKDNYLWRTCNIDERKMCPHSMKAVDERLSEYKAAIRYAGQCLRALSIYAEDPADAWDLESYGIDTIETIEKEIKQLEEEGVA